MAVAINILPGKLNRPHLGVKTLVRTRLYEQIDQSLKTSVTTIVAPAGFGKTVLLAGWMMQCPMPVAWLSLDPNDNPLPTFVRHLALAVETIFSMSCRETISLVDGQYAPTLGQLTGSLLAELGDLPKPIALILDDYHVLSNPDIHALVVSLVDRRPSRLHLIIGSRGDPLLPLARWRLNGQLGEIRARDLRFSLPEACELLELLLGVEIPLSVNEAIVARTEGWAAGLRLTALSLQGQTDISVLPRHLLGHHRYIMDYLMEEVFARQPPALQALLLRSSILDWMSEPLLKALTGADAHSSADHDPEAAEVSLRQMLRAGLFIELVSEYEGLFRYHDLFRDLLRQRLAAQAAPETIAGLHREASLWLAENGYSEDAVRHALAMGDPLAAARVVEERMHALLNQEAKRQLESLLNLLPQPIVDERPPLLIARAWLLHFEQRLNAIPPLLQRAEQLLRDSGSFPEAEIQRWRGDILTLRSQDMFWQHRPREAHALGMQAVGLLPPASHFARGLALYYAAFGLHVDGDTITARRLLRDQLEQSTPASVAADMRYLLGLCVLQQDSLELNQLHTTAMIMLRQAEAVGFLISKAWAHYFLGRARYEANDLASAQLHFSTGAALRYSANGICSHECLTGLALTYAAQGQWQQAAETAATLVEFDSTPLSVERLVHTQTLQARLALLRGDLDSARLWALRSDLEPVFDQMPLLEVAAFTRVRTLLAMNTTEDAQQALRLARQLQQTAQSISSKLRLVLSLTLQALAMDALGDRERALTQLKIAIDLGQTSHLIRTFVDYGSALRDLLRHLQHSGLVVCQDTADYLAHLLAAFPPVTKASPAPRHPETDFSLTEPLTAREAEVLALLARRLTDREIADTLVISPFTVRRHLDNIGDKVGVRSRRAMVERARRLGLISAPPA